MGMEIPEHEVGGKCKSLEIAALVKVTTMSIYVSSRFILDSNESTPMCSPTGVQAVTLI